MALKIYTRTGDDGTTSLIGGTKVPKSHLRIEAYGTVDELNSCLGLCKDLLTDDTSRKILLEAQDRLFTIGSSLACDPVKEPKMRIPDLKPEDVSLLEEEMDRMNEAIPPMKHFILPGGDPVLSHLHIARCVCRRAERCCVRLEMTEDEIVETDMLSIKYLNRLSDYLFVLSRYTGHQLQIPEIPWRPRL
ncbi:MAG: cob(I)yrinic acid a,c-diamide adenosyltransferase [Bacteroidetes bacterium]|nr:cob(I)yrinic acid a,c-diamide adenosyltransferase [Bacteroidota bacterium]